MITKHESALQRRFDKKKNTNKLNLGRKISITDRCQRLRHSDANELLRIIIFNQLATTCMHASHVPPHKLTNFQINYSFCIACSQILQRLWTLCELRCSILGVATPSKQHNNITTWQNKTKIVAHALVAEMVTNPIFRPIIFVCAFVSKFAVCSISTKTKMFAIFFVGRKIVPAYWRVPVLLNCIHLVARHSWNNYTWCIHLWKYSICT